MLFFQWIALVKQQCSLMAPGRLQVTDLVCVSTLWVGSIYDSAAAVQLQALLTGRRGEVEAPAVSPTPLSVINEAAHLLASGGYNQEYQSSQMCLRISAKCAKPPAVQLRGIDYTPTSPRPYPDYTPTFELLDRMALYITTLTQSCTAGTCP